MWRSAEAKNDPTISEQLEKANNNLNPNRDRLFFDGDIAVSRLRTLKNADPCVKRGCKWPKNTDGKVYVPYVIANNVCVQQKPMTFKVEAEDVDLIKKGLNSFTSSTGIHFIPRTNQRAYLDILNLRGCYSFVGRQGRAQLLVLFSSDCMHFGMIQHELLHALGFHHEQSRSDRDQHIQIILKNVKKGMESNFNKFHTLNQGTPYDYSSVMHYNRLVFSKDKLHPNMVAIPDRNIVFRTAKQMSQNDINRVNLLYCKN